MVYASLTQLLTGATRYLQGIPNLYNRSICQELRDQRRKYCHLGNAVFNIAGGADFVTAPASDH
jgi:hypothetical protein